MRSFVLSIAPLAALALAAGCSSSSKQSSSSASGDDGGAVDGGGSLVTVSYQMHATVPAGGEMFRCQYVQLPDTDAFMVGAQHDYTPGSHHMLLLTTDLTSIPAGQDQPQDCYEGTGTANMMNHVRGVLYGGQTPTGAEQLPPGVGLRTKASAVLVFQVHYLNPSAGDLNANVNATLTLDTNGADIQQQAGILFFYDPFIDVPAGATAKAGMRCPIPSDITLLYASSHYHSRGVGYGAYLDNSVTDLASTPFYTSNSWSSPTNAVLTMPIKAGSRLRWECDYDNSSGTQEFFSGQSAQTNEMCMFVGTYYPEMGELTDYCLQDADMFGSGSVACGATMSCLQACGGTMSFGVGGGLAGGGPTACQQTCMVKSCPSAGAPLVAFGACMSNSCSSQCSDPSASACATCIAGSCLNEYSTCQSHKCP
jgi:hypothetical protein